MMVNPYPCIHSPKLIIAGDDEYKTYTAMNRIKNYILKRLKQFSGTVLHVLEKPSKLVKIYINETPHAPYIDLPQQMIDDPKDIKRGRKFFIAEELATYESLRDLDLQMAKVDIGASAEQESKAENTGGAKDNYFQSMKYSDSMMELNTEKIRMSLENALGHVQLLECDIKMRIRFGQVALIDYPERPTWDIKELDSNVIPDTRLTSEFSPFFTDSSDKFSVLIRKLSNPEFQETPEMLWTLGILKRTQFHDYIEAQLEVSFRDDDDKVALWNALVEKTTPLDIRVISSERLFSWAWSISASKRLESDKFSPEGKFVHDMHLDRKGRDARLVYATSQDVQLKHVKREKKWSFARDPWTIELTEEAFWKFQKPSKPYQKLTLGNPDKTLYSVSIYRDSWNMRFYDNPHLGLGQLAGWKPSDFLEGEESIGKTLESISDLRDIIERLF
ncbi:hypothetical protein BGZ46_010533 [Entomortierella lignicola]|nr:hypothetical protein BGZ46_010533 [Entomortierella lignicola]